MIDANNGAIVTKLITEGELTADQLKQEFEQLAQDDQIDLNDFYRQAVNLSYAADNGIELMTLIQILLASRES